MAMTNEEKAAFEVWLEGRPEVIKDMAHKYPPWKRYRIKSTGQECVLYSYSEAGTVTVDAEGLVFDHRVFGIPVSDLVEIAND